MAKKNVYAALEIADHEVRLVVAEIFNDRSNVLRVERAEHSGIQEGKITDEKAVIQAIEQAVQQAQNALGYRIERVLLAIPAKKVHPVNNRVQIEIEDGTHTVRRFHVQQGLKSAMMAQRFDAEELVNVNKIDYFIDGIRQEKIPLGMDTEVFDMEIDLLYADKETVYAYAAIVEKAGLQILDLVLDIYGAAKETGALLQSKDRPVILIDLEADHTTLAFLNQNKLAFTTVLSKGYSSFIQSLKEEYSLSDAAAWRLLENLFDSREVDANEVVIYIEQQDDQRVEITKKQLAQAVLPQIRSWIGDINAGCMPILESTPARYLITGQGTGIPALRQFVNAFNAPASIYHVTTIGARNGCYVVPLGMMYAWEDINKVSNREVTSVNNNELEESIESITRYGKEQEGGFTKKLRKAMLSNTNKE